MKPTKKGQVDFHTETTALLVSDAYYYFIDEGGSGSMLSRCSATRGT